MIFKAAMVAKLIQLLEEGLSSWIWRTLFLALSATVLLGSLLFRPTFASGPDVPFHIYNAQRFADEIQAGVWYPRWLGDWYGGYGAPIGVVYPPLLYYTVAILAFLGFPTIIALKIVIWGSLFASGIVMYKLAAPYMSPMGALMAGLLYQVAPYRLIDLYSRTALAEYMSFLWLPLVLLMIVYCIQERRLIYYVGLASAVAALLLTHLLIAYLFAIMSVLFAAYIILRSGNQWPLTAFRLGIGVGLGALLAAGYILPALVERQYLDTRWVQEADSWGNYLNNYLFAAQVYLGTVWQRMYIENIYIGVGAVLGIALGGLAFVINIRNWRQRPPQSRDMALAMSIVLALSALMSFNISRPLWTILPYSQLIEFPWRWQTITALAVAYLGGDAIGWIWQNWLNKRVPFQWRSLTLPLLLTCILGAHLLYAGVLIWRFHQRLSEQQVEQFLGKQPLPVELYDWVYDNPYLPRWIPNFNYIADPASKKPSVISDQPAQIEIQQWLSSRRIFTVSTPVVSTINVRTFWFPGWQATVNGQNATLNIQPHDGTMNLSIPAGKSEVIMTFGDTPIRSVGMGLSGGAALVLLGLMALSGYRRFRGKYAQP